MNTKKREIKIAILAIGYNRVPGMKRLLESLEKASYLDDEVDLIISVDNSGKNDVVECAEKFIWSHGRKKVVTFEERQGLRAHILKCGDWLEQYDALAVFEDDIVAAPGYYIYAKESVEFYQNDANIAGISLYNHLWNVNACYPFQPAYSNYDVYFIQFAQSWGQIWMKNQWFEFKRWYLDNSDEYKPQDNIPDFVSNWGKNSWLKYHIKYCIEKNKYFVYPYRSLTTCFSDVGEHSFSVDTRFQVPLLTAIKENYSFPELRSKESVLYDAFFERQISDGKYGEMNYEDICFDLYGTKNSTLGKRYLLSSKRLPYRVISGFALTYRPQELNFFYEVAGEEIWLYDTFDKKLIKAVSNEVNIFKYRFRLFRQRELLRKYTFFENVQEIKEKINRIKKLGKK